MTTIHPTFAKYVHEVESCISNIPWWIYAAIIACEENRVQWIASRDGSALYLGRFWLSAPLPAGDDGATYESGNAVLLHYFAQADDDGSLHDHPWSFESEVLAGGYTERRPNAAWREQFMGQAMHDPSILGLPWDACERVERRAGTHRACRSPIDQHAVEDVRPGTWTLMKTGPRVRSWGFHPPGLPWTPWREFLAAKLSTTTEKDFVHG